VEVVMEAVRLRERIAAADLVVTGEGSLDAQSLRGKVVAGVLGAAREAGVPALVLCGRGSVEVPGVRVASLVARFGAERAMGDARAALADLAAEAAAEVGAGVEGAPPAP
jgi:glycerate kinase